MQFEKRIITLKNGKSCTLCPADPKYAKDMIDYLTTVSGETDFLLRYPDEVTFTEEKEKEFLQAMLDSEKEFMMMAEVDGIIAGNCSISSEGTQRRIKHRCSFAIALKKDYWNLGIGTAMIQYSMELAKKIGYEQAELEVVEENDRAKALYEKSGFEVTGKNINAFKFDDGSYRDEFTMVKIF